MPVFQPAAGGRWIDEMPPPPAAAPVSTSPARARTGWLYAGLGAANLAAWGWAWSAFQGRPVLLGTALLAWVFGLRHAVDADHIAAIDNVVRKLMQAGDRPLTVGLWFSLGHSTIVVLASLAVVAAAATAPVELTAARLIGVTAGTLVSATFLIMIAAANLFVLRGVWMTIRRVRRGGSLDPMALDKLLSGRGLLARLLRPALGAITRSWHMYPLGFLFGLGFDTATEVGLLAISATQVVQGLSPWQVMVFPALFTAGMALVDTTDSVLMVAAYGWAFVDPLRKLWYNLTVTALSVVVALLIGGIEALGLVGSRLALTGPFWSVVGRLNGGLGSVGFALVAAFALCWIASTLLWRWTAFGSIGTGPS
jgi:high-affinity nickel-transport protein